MSMGTVIGTSHDLYEESEDLAAALEERGTAEAAERIRDVIARGSTSSEICSRSGMSLTGCLIAARTGTSRWQRG
jgi:hypothetical protein